eukprot:scaffold237612_cov22-Tisochrysis_lutea.AAC.1
MTRADANGLGRGGEVPARKGEADARRASSVGRSRRGVDFSAQLSALALAPGWSVLGGGLASRAGAATLALRLTNPPGWPSRPPSPPASASVGGSVNASRRFIRQIDHRRSDRGPLLHLGAGPPSPSVVPVPLPSPTSS